MKEREEWLPDLILFEDYDGSWHDYVMALYSVFQKDFVDSQPRFLGRWVRCRRDPICDGKYAGFWHCISEGENEEERTPDLRRCERVPWIRPIIERAGMSENICVWSKEMNAERRYVLWYREEFIIILAERERKRDGFTYLQMITAYCTPEEHRRRKLRKEFSSYSKNG